MASMRRCSVKAGKAEYVLPPSIGIGVYPQDEKIQAFRGQLHFFATGVAKFPKVFKDVKVEGIQFDETKLLATPWSSAKKETITSEYDVEEMFNNLMKRLDGAFKKHSESGIVIKNSELYDYLSEARDRFNAVKFSANDEVEQVA